MVKTQIALLRGINVGGHHKVPMAELRALCESIGWKDVKSYIQSGNLIFQSTREHWRLESELEQAIQEHFSFDIPVIIRTGARWQELLAGNPFSDVSRTEPNRVMLGLAKSAPAAGAAVALQEYATSGERIRVVDNALWMHFPNGSGRSKVTPALLDRLAGSPVTTRNWRTALKIKLLARDSALSRS